MESENDTQNILEVDDLSSEVAYNESQFDSSAAVTSQISEVQCSLRVVPSTYYESTPAKSKFIQIFIIN